MMIDKITELLNEKVGFESIAIFIGGVILCLFVIWFFISITKFCFSIEKVSGKASYTLLKTIIIAFVPTLYSILDLLGFSDVIPTNIIVPICVVLCILVAVWNILVYGVVVGLLFTMVHIVFGAIASMGVSALVFIIFAGVLLFFFGSSVGDSATSTSGGSAPSLVRDVHNGQTYYVRKGLNGELYIEDHGRSCRLRLSDYDGVYLDDYGNRYVK